MRGLMSERPLLISGILQHAANFHADTEIVSRLVDGSIHRYTYAEADRRSRQLAQALLRLGIEPGDRVGTMAWNTFRHFELYYAISGIGAACHTLNPRLPAAADCNDRAGGRLPDRAAVSRLRLGYRLHRADERREAGLPRREARRRQLVRAVQRGGRDVEPRRPDGVARL